jgi:hypothetical protein
MINSNTTIVPSLFNLNISLFFQAANKKQNSSSNGTVKSHESNGHVSNDNKATANGHAETKKDK